MTTQRMFVIFSILNYWLIAVDFARQKELDADPRVFKKIQFYRMLETKWDTKTKETVLEFYKGTTKVL